MFRTAVLRAARLPRVAAASSSLVAGGRLAVLRSSSIPQTTILGRAVPSMSAVARFSRNYSANAAAAESTPEAATEAKQPLLITKFSELGQVGVHGNLVDALTKGMGYETMTPVQSKTMGPALAGKDVVAQAKTGTGKTLAFLIPTIQRMINETPDLAYPKRVRAKSSDIRAIIMSPTRELAEQIGKEARALTYGTGIVVQTAVGGTQKGKMLAMTRAQGCHLLVATPGRLNDLLQTPDSGIAAPQLAALVLDEADRMLDVGFSDELRQIVQQLPNRATTPRQTLMFSATVPKNVISLARTYIDPKNFEFVQTVDPNDALTHEKVPQHIVSVNGYENIYPTLLELFRREIAASKQTDGKMPFKAIVFLPTTAHVRLTSAVFQSLRRNDRDLPQMFNIHSKLTQSARTFAADSFRRSLSSVLFSSDVTARGMDFPNVSHVIQVGVPPDREQYIHRLGRTGRADKGGEGWTIIAKDELPVARRILVDLPIQRADGLESAEYDLGNEDETTRPKAVSEVTAIMKRAPGELLTDAYMSFFGGQTPGRHPQLIADCLYDWTTKGWGWEKPPAINKMHAAKRGLLNLRNINIGSSQPSESYRTQNDMGDSDEFAQAFADNAHNNRPRSDHGNSRGGFGGRGGRSSQGGSSFERRGGSSYERRDRGGAGFERRDRGGSGFERRDRGGSSFERRDRGGSSFERRDRSSGFGSSRGRSGPDHSNF